MFCTITKINKFLLLHLIHIRTVEKLIIAPKKHTTKQRQDL